MNEKDINNQIIKCIKQGMTIGKISQVLSIPQLYIRECLTKMEKAGIDLSRDSKELDIETDIIVKIEEDIISEIDKKILELSKEGLKEVEIARKLNRSRNDIAYRKRLMKKLGIEIPDIKSRIDKENKQIINMLAEGMLQKEIAKKIGVNENTISLRIKKMREMGIEIPKKIDEIDNRILQMLENGLNQSQISRTIGVSRQRISQRVKKISKTEELKNNKINEKTAKYFNLSKEDIEQAILNLAKTKNATFKQMQEIAKDYDIDLSRTLYCADIEER